MEFLKANGFVIAATAYGGYSAGKSWWNLQAGQGCAKCETTGVLFGLAVGAWGGVLLFQAATAKKAGQQ